MGHAYQGAEKFIVDRFFKESFDGRSKINVEQLVHDKLVADDKAKDPAYYANRVGTVHASQLYSCQRGLLLSMLGIEPPPKDEKGAADERRTLGIFKAGNLFEEFIVSSLPGIVERQREYELVHSAIRLVGRSDFRLDDAGVMRIGEVKSVNSNAFWYRKKEGTLIAWQNQVQLQTYLWLERKLNGNAWDGLFAYVSKDDCTVDGCAVKFDQGIIDEIVLPTLDALNHAFVENQYLVPEYARLKAAHDELANEDDRRDIRRKMDEVVAKVDFGSLPLPPLAVFNHAKQQYQSNWLADYCDQHDRCAGAGWVLSAVDEVKRKNKDFKLGFIAGGTA